VQEQVPAGRCPIKLQVAPDHEGVVHAIPVSAVSGQRLAVSGEGSGFGIVTIEARFAAWELSAARTREG
jgi:hypothetical protein